MADFKRQESQKLETKKTKPLEVDTNPCYKEQRLSYECLSKNNYDASKCYLPFENYKECKAFWNTIRIERMRHGIEPYIPVEAERKQILNERFKGKKQV